jgi:hypothetical protein
MLQHPFLHATALIDSDTTDHHTQPSALLSNLKSIHHHQVIHLINTQIMKSSYNRQLPNLLMLDSDSKKSQIFPNIHNVSFISLGKLCDDKYEAKLIKNQCTFHRGNNPITIIPRSFKTGMHAIDLIQPMFRNESKERKSLANSSIEQKQSKIIDRQCFILLKRLQFYHVSLGAHLCKL